MSSTQSLSGNTAADRASSFSPRLDVLSVTGITGFIDRHESIAVVTSIQEEDHDEEKDFVRIHCIDHGVMVGFFERLEPVYPGTARQSIGRRDHQWNTCAVRAVAAVPRRARGTISERYGAWSSDGQPIWHAGN